MSISNIHVSLSESLEVRGGPLEESELWAILCQASEALQDLFLQGKISLLNLPQFPITPDSLLLCENGRVRLITSSKSSAFYDDCLPPEFSDYASFTDEDIEKMFVFSLGMTLYSAADFRLAKDQDLKISRELDELLSSMCNEDPLLRLTLFQVLHTWCNSSHRLRNFVLPNSHFVMKLHRLVLGSDENLPHRDSEALFSGQSVHQSRLKSRSKQSVNQRSRSSSKSGSRSRDGAIHYIFLDERPVPIGRDQFSDATYNSSRSTARTPRYTASHSQHRHRESKSGYRSDSELIQVPNSIYLQRQNMHPKQALIENKKQRSSVGMNNFGGYARLDNSFGVQSATGQMTERIFTGDGKMSSVSDPLIPSNLEQTYQRLNERRRHLDALRRGILVDDVSESSSSNSEMIGTYNVQKPSTHYYSASSSPGYSLFSGDQVPLASYHRGDDNRRTSINFLSNEIAWLDRREKEIEYWRISQLNMADEQLASHNSSIDNGTSRLLDEKRTNPGENYDRQRRNDREEILSDGFIMSSSAINPGGRRLSMTHIENGRGSRFDQERPTVYRENDRGSRFDQERPTVYREDGRGAMFDQERTPAVYHEDGRGAKFDQEFERPTVYREDGRGSRLDQDRTRVYREDDRGAKFDQERTTVYHEDGRGSSFDQDRTRVYREDDRGAKFDQKRSPAVYREDGRGSRLDQDRTPGYHEDDRGAKFDQERTTVYREDGRGSKFDQERTPMYREDDRGARFDQERTPMYREDDRGAKFDQERTPGDREDGRGSKFDQERTPVYHEENRSNGYHMLGEELSLEGSDDRNYANQSNKIMRDNSSEGFLSQPLADVMRIKNREQHIEVADVENHETPFDDNFSPPKKSESKSAATHIQDYTPLNTMAPNQPYVEEILTDESSKNFPKNMKTSSVEINEAKINSANIPAKKKLKASEKTRRKDFGPEFAKSYPSVSLVLRESTGVSEANMRHVIVVLLSGANLEITCSINNTGRQLYDCVVSHLAIPETPYFGLVYLQDDEYFFLEPDTKLHKIAPPDWNKRKKFSNRPISSFVLYFRVKFYVTDIKLLRFLPTRHLLYLQLRRDVLDERIQIADNDTPFVLAGFALQAEYGDETDRAVEAGLVHYFSAKFLQLVGASQARDMLMLQYENLSGLSDMMAEEAFIKELMENMGIVYLGEAGKALAQIPSVYELFDDSRATSFATLVQKSEREKHRRKCMQLKEYGVHFYKVFKNKKQPHEPAWAGISLPAILIAVDQGTRRVITKRHTWHSTTKISFNRHRFSITIQTRNDPDEYAKFNYYTDSYKKCQYLLQLSSEHHRFKLVSQMSQSLESGLIESQQHSRIDKNRMNRSQFSLNDSLDEDVNRNNCSNNQEADEEEKSLLGSSKSEFESPMDDYDRGASEQNSLKQSTPSEKNLKSEIAVEPLPIAPPDEQSYNFIVDLMKDPKLGFGIGLAVDSVHSGVVVKSLVPEGPAEKDGRLQAGDCVIAINGELVGGGGHVRALELLRQSNSFVQLSVIRSNLFILERRKSVSPIQNGVEDFNRPMTDPWSWSQVKPTTMKTASPTNSKESVVDAVDMNSDAHHKHALMPLEKNNSQASATSHDSVDTVINRTSGSGIFTNSLKSGDRYKVTLKKRNNSLGLGIKVGTNANVDGIFISSLSADGSAIEEDKIQIGDQLLQVNDISFVNVTHRQATETLRSAPLVCTLVLERRDPSWSPSYRSSFTGSEIYSGKTSTESIKDDRATPSSLSYAEEDAELIPTRAGQTRIPDRQFSVSSNTESEMALRTDKMYSNQMTGSQSSRSATTGNQSTEKSTDTRPFSLVENSAHRPRIPSSSSAQPGSRDSRLSLQDEGRSSRATSRMETSDVFESEVDPLSSSDSLNGSEVYRNYSKKESTFQRQPAKLLDNSMNPLTNSTLQDQPAELNRLVILRDVPKLITDDWLQSLPVVTLPKESQRYSDANLDFQIQKLKSRLEHDDPLVEFKGFKQERLSDLTLVGVKTENKSKNRYRNVLPYDKTRVVLSGLDDYINASHISYEVGSKCKLDYIAAQGPLLSTVDDFWRMIWEHKVDVVAMLTQEVEGGKSKCARYWPELAEDGMIVCNRYSITQVEHQCVQYFDIRFFQIDDLESKTRRLVTHLNFTEWPDHSTPQSGLPLLQFIQLLKCVHQTGPILVHCSAGIGRTGAMLTISICLALIECDLKFDIESIVQDLRKQRPGMIQTKDQYRFCYTTVLDALEMLRQQEM